MLKLTFYQNSEGAIVGNLDSGDRRLLATTHPATIAAAIFALDEYELEVATVTGSIRVSIPIETEVLDPLEAIMASSDMGKFMSGFATFSRLDFANPSQFDTSADVHFRTAVHHLPNELVKLRPAEPAPKDFSAELKNRNQYIYFPDC
ncbi:hypothetical protein [Paraburkholderia sp. GAS348]|uniref:hypothetical protein n=1 Tax=Paraburkholderia sp. GAS348 TaxID=3035132 RepID=UPI003D1B0539